MMLPPMVAMLRSWAEALSSSASDTTGKDVRTRGSAATSAIVAKAPRRMPPWRVGVMARIRSALMSTNVSGRSTSSRIRSTSVVPPAMKRPPRCAAATAAGWLSTSRYENGRIVVTLLRRQKLPVAPLGRC
jgi:hypothetical protein